MKCDPEALLSVLVTTDKKDREGYVEFAHIVRLMGEGGSFTENDICVAIRELEDRGLALPYDIDRRPQANRWRTP